MKYLVISTIAGLILPLAALAQSPPSNSVCATETELPADVLINICTNEHGMAPLAQPRLYLRVRGDGRVEFETESRTDQYRLVKKAIVVKPEEVSEMILLSVNADLWAAKDEYPMILRGDDSSMETTLTLRDPATRGTKRILLHNYSEVSQGDFEHYPRSLNLLMERAMLLWERGFGIKRPILAINFSDVYLHPERYERKLIDIYAQLDFDAETATLTDDPDDQDAAGKPARKLDISLTGPKLLALIPKTYWDALTPVQRSKVKDQSSTEHARVQVRGTLRDGVFNIESFRHIDPIVLNYEGTLKPGWVYSDEIGFRPASGGRTDAGPELSSPFKLPIHHAGRVEWTNLVDFPAWSKPGHKWITFRVLTVESRQMEKYYWRTTITCEVLEIRK
jgi:hypothetical protein